MAAATDELILLERVFLRLGSAEMDEQLQAAVGKFLPPVLLKLSSTQEGVRKKVMELLIHINKRLKSRPKVQLPVEALLLQYQDPAASSFVTNFTIIYIKMGYPRMEISKQAELVPSVLNAIEGKPQSHQDSLMFIIMPALGHIKIPMDPEKRASLLGLRDKPYVAKLLSNFMLDTLLISYGITIIAEHYDQPIDWTQMPTPPGFSDYEFKRTMGENPRPVDQLEKTKLGIVKFISGGFFPESDILVHLIVAATDTRFSVANLANVELKKIVNSVDWSSPHVSAPLYSLFLGTTQKDVKQELRRAPIDLFHRLKLMEYLCRVTDAGFIIPPCIQVVFESLYGKVSTLKLQTLALQFTLNIVQQCNLMPLVRVAGVILNGMLKLIAEGNPAVKPMAYTIIGQLGKRLPNLVNKDLSILQKFFDTLTSSKGDLRRTIQDALIAMTPAFVLNKEDDNGITMMNALLCNHIENGERPARYVAVHYAATVFPSNEVSSRYLLLFACCDPAQEVKIEAFKAVYGTTAYKNERDKRDAKGITFPDFSKLVSYIHSKVQSEINSVKNNAKFDNSYLPYNICILAEMITYMRLCLANIAGVPSQSELLQHPCEYSSIIGRYMDTLYKENPDTLNNYLDLVVRLAHASSGTDKTSLDALLEVIGTIPHHTVNNHEKELPWLRTLLSSTKEQVREPSAKIYAIIVAHTAVNDFEEKISEIISMTKSSKTLETQHGALLALCHMMERKLTIKKNEEQDLSKWKVYVDVINVICTFLSDKNALLVNAAMQSIGIISKICALPLPVESIDDKFTKKSIMEKLMFALDDTKINSKIKERAAMSLGFLCVGEDFPFTKEIIANFIKKAEETRDFDVHLTIGEALVCCVHGPASPKARNAWKTLSSEYQIPFSEKSDELLSFTLDNLLQLSQKPHPNSRQAVCIWLLALVKHNSKRKCVMEKMSAIQNAFMDFLSENSEIVQDIASKGICLIYDSSVEEDRKALVSNITSQLLHGKRTVNQVTGDTKLFEDGQLGKSPTGGNISTYREICSLASDLNKPELIYKFLHLANHNAIWTSKKGAAFGFSAIAAIASEELNKHLPLIIPKLYRYQFDPTPKTQQTMTSIWHAIVPSTSKAIEQYHKEILEDLAVNLTNNQWRVRHSVCNALIDLLKSNAPYDLIEFAPELWKQLFRVMDDIHEGTRVAATNTAKVLSKICIRHCDSSNGKAGERVLQAILPVLLDVGITHTVLSVRSLSLQTVSQLLSSAGNLLKPSLVNLIPALLAATGELENLNSAAFHVLFGATSVSHFTTDTMAKCIQYIDEPILKELMPKVLEPMKSSVSVGTKIACSQFFVLLSSHLKLEMQSYAGKILSILVNGLMDRNIIIKKNYASTIGYLVGCAKESSLEKLFNTLNTWYMEREDNSIRLAIGQSLQSINNHNQEVLRNYSNIVMPLVFFAMHAEKVQENEETIRVWVELWSEISPGTELGIRQNLDEIIKKSSEALESASWTTKAQAANAISTMASRMGTDVNENARITLLNVLTSGLQGRTWKGKERLLNALSTLACNSKEMLKKDTKLMELVLDTLYKESKKEAVEYRRHALKSFSDVLHELDVDRFTRVYDIAQEILSNLSNKDSDDEDNATQENTNKRENKIKLQEAVYEALGKAWPSSKETQDKYCLEFVTYCNDTLPNSIRTVQVTILTTLNMYIDKLILFKINSAEMLIEDKKMLVSIFELLEKILRTSIGISKYTRIRKEALNMILSLLKKMRETKNNEQFEKIKKLFQEHLPELHKDNQPEIRSRVVDIKAMLNI